MLTLPDGGNSCKGNMVERAYETTIYIYSTQSLVQGRTAQVTVSSYRCKTMYRYYFKKKQCTGC
jgi:hypothetical protein